MPAAAASQERLPAASQTWTPDKDEQDDLAAINATLSHLRTATAPDPYVLTIPQDVEPRYHHQHRAWAEQWLSHAPFERNEHESLQYQTFIFHEHGKDMYVLQNSLPPAEEPKVNGNGKAKPATGANTPNAAPKKKITLGTYKKQKSGATGTPERDVPKASDLPPKQPAVKGPVERVKAETEEMLAIVAADKELLPVEPDKSHPAKNDLKRKREDLPVDQRDKTAHAKQETNAAPRPTTGAEPLAKKPKVSVPEPLPGHAKKQSIGSVKSLASDKTSSQPGSINTAMPPRLSPGMPPRLSPGLPEKLSPLQKNDDSTLKSQSTQAVAIDQGDIRNLPPRLSPTIPDNIAKTLETRTHSQSTPQALEPTSASGSAAKSREEKLTPLKKLDSLAKRRSPAPINGFRASSSSPAVRSDAEDRPRPTLPVSSAKLTAPAHEESIVVGKAASTDQSDQYGKKSLIVKLKYKRSRREDVARILKLPPRPAKQYQTQRAPTPNSEDSKSSRKPIEKRNGERKDPSQSVKGVAQKVGPVKKEKKERPAQEEKPAVAEKRPPLEDDKAEPPAKRKRADVPEVRKDPATPAPREVDSPLAPKSAQQATPGVRKEHLSVAMRREQSQDSIGTYNTPPEVSSTPTINSSLSHTAGTGRPPSSQPSKTTAKQQAWETEQRRLETLGRELKHAASAHLAASQQDAPNKVQEQRLAAVKSIESFLCYVLAFTCADEAATAAEPKQSPTYKIWRSLSGFFGFVKKTTEPFGPLSGLACTLGMVFNARILAIVTQHPGDGPSRNELLETQALMQRSAADAEVKLDIDILQEMFPKSWRERTKRAIVASEKLDLAKLGGQYKLPIGVSTPPLRAARAGYAMLLEWMEKEKINYSLKLKL